MLSWASSKSWQLARLGVGIRGLSSIRSPKYAKVLESDITFFKNVVGGTGVITGEEEMKKYNRYTLELKICFSQGSYTTWG